MSNTDNASINLDINPKTYAPNICQYSRRRGSPEGQQLLYMFVDNVSKGNIGVNFFELNSATKKRIWMTRIPIGDHNMHHQYGICFYTPAYKEIDIEEDVSVFMELESLSDGRRSTPRVFTYEADEFYKKRKERNIFLEKMRRKVENDVALTPVSQNGAEIQDTLTQNIEAAADGDDFIIPFSAVEAYTEPTKIQKGVNTQEVIYNTPYELPYNFDDFCRNLDSLAYMGPHADDVECPSALIKEIFHLMKQSVHRWYEEARQNLEKLFEMRSPEGDTFLHMLLVSHLPSFKVMVDVMFSLGLYNLLNVANDLGQTVLHLAIMGEMVDIIPYLIEKGCNPECRDNKFNNALHLAITRPASLEPLLKSINKKEYRVEYLAMSSNENGDTALLAAVKLGHLRSVQQLLAADLMALYDRKSLYFAVANDRLDIVQELIQQLPRGVLDDWSMYWSSDLRYYVSPLELACAGEVRQNTLAIIKLLLDKQASKNITYYASVPAWQRAKQTPAIWEVVRPYLDEESLSEHENTSHSTADDERLSTDDGGSKADENNIVADIETLNDD